MKSILDPTFKYVPAVKTDLRITFARVRREMRETETAVKDEQIAKVRDLPVRKANK